ncbi:MAG: HD domain-containing protein [Actinomycetota bacterium]|nr:HD domain-containing protein [Actinomycetota bacterium]
MTRPGDGLGQAGDWTPTPEAGAMARSPKELRPVDPVEAGEIGERVPSDTTPVSLDDVKGHEGVQTFIELADQYLGEIGYTEHGFRHAGLVSSIAYNVLHRLDFEDRLAELASIAGYLHDLGNFVSRTMHSQTGATITYDLLRQLGMSYGEIGIVMAAIGNHEEEFGHPVNAAGAALIVADKSDVHRSRVREQDPALFDIHDRVNHAVEHSFLRVDSEARTLTLELTIDTELAGVMEYFEIFLSRMVMCRRAAEYLSCKFRIDINGAKLL